MKYGLPFLLVIGLVSATVSEDKTAATYEPTHFFRTQILPILETRCFECHSEAEGQDDGGLVLDTKAGWIEGGDHGPAVVPKNIGKSPLIRAILSHDPGTVMPPDDPLPPLEIALLQTWVLLGAPDPRE
ncbi:MAG: c-type cytochrome domain-containing protein [Verrucomicrobiales bacterium]